MPGRELLQVPPDTALLKVVMSPVHTALDPVMAAGDVLTVNGVVTMQPADEI